MLLPNHWLYPGGWKNQGRNIIECLLQRMNSHFFFKASLLSFDSFLHLSSRHQYNYKTCHTLLCGVNFVPQLHIPQRNPPHPFGVWHGILHKSRLAEIYQNTTRKIEVILMKKTFSIQCIPTASTVFQMRFSFLETHKYTILVKIPYRMPE